MFTFFNDNSAAEAFSKVWVIIVNTISIPSENALRALTIDVVENLQRAAEVIGSESHTEEMKVNAMETILNYIDDIDTAIDFCKIGGLFVLIPCLSSEHSKIRNMSALIIAELTQNNPYCQKQLLDLDVLPKLMNLLNEEGTAVNGLRAISCLVRNYEPCLQAFTSIGGLECLLGCLQQSQQEKVTTKTAFFLRNLCSDFPDIKEELIRLKVIELLIPLIHQRNDYNVCLETLLSALCSLTEHNEAIECCRTQDFNLKNTLEGIVQQLEKKPECGEIVEYAQNLLKRITVSKQDVEITDR